MNEDGFNNKEFPQHPESDMIPEHSVLPEYNPVYPDITFFKESSVTCREENIFQGHPPAGEDPYEEKREKRKKRERYSLLQSLLGSAVKGGVALLSAMAVVALVSSDGDSTRSEYAPQIAAAVENTQRPVFTQQTGYSVTDFSKLWNGDPSGPHKYDLKHPQVTKKATCTEQGAIDYVCIECGVRLHGIIPAAGHQPVEAHRQDEIPATCTTAGSYTEKVVCAVCGEELSEIVVTVAMKGHTALAPVRENEIAATCLEDGTYQEVVYCADCGEEISRTTLSSAALGHSAGDEIRENEVDATCTEEGSYDSVVYCSRCGELVSRKTVTVAALGHNAGNVKKENVVDATCTEKGSYDSVVYCSRCGERISSKTVTVAALGHDAEDPVKENEVDATCTEEGSYDSVVYCSRCGERLSSKTVTVAALGHTAEDPVQENYILEDCLDGGSYEEVTYCSVCGEEISRKTVTIEPTDHTAGDTERIWLTGIEDENGNVTGPDCLDGGSYEDVTYCSVCGTEMMRSEETYVDGTGHVFNTSPSNGEVLTCTKCGAYFMDSYIYNNYVYYSVDMDYLEEMNEAGVGFQTVKLWSYTAEDYINQRGYEYGDDGGSTVIPEEYRTSGERFRMDCFFDNDLYVSSNDVEYE